MYNQLLLPIGVFEPNDFSSVVRTIDNSLAVEWLMTWGHQGGNAGTSKGINYTCLIGSQSRLLAAIWARTTNAQSLPSDARLFKSWYKLMDKKQSNKCYTLDDPEIIRNEQMILYILNSIKERNSYLLLTTKIHPNSWRIKLPDLKSRILTINVLTC